VERNYYNTLSIIIFSLQTLIFFTRDIEREGEKGREEREREREGRREERGGERDTESKILKEKQS